METSTPEEGVVERAPKSEEGGKSAESTQKSNSETLEMETDKKGVSQVEDVIEDDQKGENGSEGDKETEPQKEDEDPGTDGEDVNKGEDKDAEKEDESEEKKKECNSGEEEADKTEKEVNKEDEGNNDEDEKKKQFKSQLSSMIILPRGQDPPANNAVSEGDVQKEKEVDTAEEAERRIVKKRKRRK